jgi:hypothetical protein
MGRIIPGLYAVAFNGELIIPLSEGCLGIGIGIGIGTEAANPLPIPFPFTLTASFLKIFCKKYREEGILF